MTAANFISWRHALGLSQAAAAKEIGISIRMLQYYEWGQAPIPRTVELACAAVAAGIGEIK